ncbi:MAG: DUF4097 family beta strand repeat protein [Anaerolineae bacterium]|nr:DUF4097 family beta strand repeat protein [Anaerolineae bacterium]
MDERNFSVEGPAQVHIQNIDGDLEVVGWSEGQISVVADEDEMPDAQWTEGVLVVRGGQDMQLRLPTNSQLSVERCDGDVSLANVATVSLKWVGGDAEVQNVTNLNVEFVASDLAVRNAGNVSGGQIQGDFEAHRIGNISLARVSGDVTLHQAQEVTITSVMGDLTIHEAQTITAAQVYGDATLHMVSGNVQMEVVRGDVQVESAEQVNIDSVNGDFAVSEARGALHVKHVNGDARLQGLASEASHQVHADGDLAIGLTPGPVRLDVRAHGSIRWDRSLGLNVEMDNRRQLVASLGEGGGQITATTHGSAAIFAAGDERGRRGRGRWNVAGTPVPPVPPVPPIPPIPPIPSVRVGGPGARTSAFGFTFGNQPRQRAAASAEERAAILRMLSEGKINAEQAARLLDALGG